jgi:hypothetical protein
MKAQERKEKIDIIRMRPSRLESSINGLTDKQLDTPYREGGWTVRQVVHHLADSHLNAYVRMKLILTEQKPQLKPYDQDAWASLPDSSRMPVGVSLEILRGLHDRWSTILEQLPEESWSREGFHPENGNMTLEDLLNTYAAHGEKHVGHILGLRSAKGW